jgi:hypothetical protein
MTRHSTDTGLTERDVDLLKTLEKWGWFVTKVGAGNGESAFAYSMGLYENFHHPEIVLFGLDLEEGIGSSTTLVRGFEKVRNMKKAKSMATS